MYEEHFGFTATPFSIAPDPRYLFMSEQHREALAHLLYGIKSDGGFVMLTGEVGTGKTTVCRCLLEQVPENTDIAFIINPKLTVQELLATICGEFGIKCPEGNTSNKVFVDHLNEYLLTTHAKSRNAVLIIDEAQNLSPDVLEQLRLLTNLETNQRKLLKIMLIGQPELKEMLARPELRQLAQRITARYHLEPLSQTEVGAYVAHRLTVAGVPRHLLRQFFPPNTISQLFRLSDGIPRLINVICDRALLGAYAQGNDGIDKATLKKAAKEVLGERKEGKRGLGKTTKWLLAGLGLTIGGAMLATAYYKQMPQPAPSPTPVEIIEQHTAEPAEQAPPTPAEEIITQQEFASIEWPQEQPLDDSRNIAFQSLFLHWGIDYDPAAAPDPCKFAETQHLRCLDLTGSLDSLIHLNRPAILTLSSGEGEEFYATVVSVSGQLTTLTLGRETKKVRTEDILPKWYGDFTLLWAAPSQYEEAIQPGESGAVVEWLESKMAEIKGRPPRFNPNLTFDDQLVQEVKQFQFTKNLVPDGIVGPLTIVHLNSEANAQVPKLIETRKGN